MDSDRNAADMNLILAGASAETAYSKTDQPQSRWSKSSGEPRWIFGRGIDSRASITLLQSGMHMAEPAEPADDPSEPTSQDTATQIGNAFAALQQAGNAGANWFFWIAALSLVNTAMAHGGGDSHFIIGLAITAVVDAIAQAIGKEHPESATLAMGIAVGFSVCVAAVVVLFGWLSRRRLIWIFAIGMALYLLDGLLYLIFGDFFSAAFHGYALYCMSRGFAAFRQMAQLETALRSQAALQTLEGSADDDELSG
jgi:hypothetical protein